MKFVNESAEIYIPDQTDENKAIERTTHMAIGAHQDDIEIMAYHGIIKCFQLKNNHFFGCVVTNGSGSARDNVYKDYTNQEMIEVRKIEQKKAAYLGEYGALALLDYPSKMVKDKSDEVVVNELKTLLSLAKPKILYTHNLADKHDTHVGVVTKVIKAIRSMPKSERPEKLLGCEVWRNLDWVNDDEKEYLDVSKHPNLAASLVEVFDSQIIGGKRYDLATIGRRLSNATFNASHAVDETNAITYAMDLTPLILDDELDVIEFISNYIKRFEQDVINRIHKVR
ncbi:MAG: PIG-L family deacetylase [Tenericutes bacterium]|jgi:LmbE family N-acetylglucosaminyl deacetylase|nr:PIG-L family deacetylase [Mycoplasmatota bacterium]